MDQAFEAEFGLLGELGALVQTPGRSLRPVYEEEVEIPRQTRHTVLGGEVGTAGREKTAGVIVLGHALVTWPDVGGGKAGTGVEVVEDGQVLAIGQGRALVTGKLVGGGEFSRTERLETRGIPIVSFEPDPPKSMKTFMTMVREGDSRTEGLASTLFLEREQEVVETLIIPGPGRAVAQFDQAVEVLLGRPSGQFVGEREPALGTVFRDGHGLAQGFDDGLG